MFGNTNPFPFFDKFVESWVAPKGTKYDLLANHAFTRSRQITKHDFENSVAADVTNKWTIIATSTATTWAVLAEPGGWIRGVTGASVATGAVGLNGANKFWNGTKGAGFASLIRLSTVTNIRLEQGFVDVAPAAGVHAVNVASASFNSVTTGAVYVFDNGVAASSTYTALWTVGVSTAAQNVATTTNRYASGVTLFVAMEINGTTVHLFVGDNTGPIARVTTAFAATESWVPWFQAKTASGSVNVDVDALWTWTIGRN
jgi:hypothetical protein